MYWTVDRATDNFIGTVCLFKSAGASMEAPVIKLAVSVYQSIMEYHIQVFVLNGILQSLLGTLSTALHQAKLDGKIENFELKQEEDTPDLCLNITFYINQSLTIRFAYRNNTEAEWVYLLNKLHAKINFQAKEKE